MSSPLRVGETPPSECTEVFDALVLAGGRGERLDGTGKAHIPVAGRPLLEHALAAVTGARNVVVVAPPGVAPARVRSVFEDPPLGGPVAGIAAGLAALQGVPGTGENVPTGTGTGTGTRTDDDVPVLVLACDVPGAAPAVPLLLRALRAAPDADGAALVDAEGRRQTLVAVYRGNALRAAVQRREAAGGVHGVSVRRLVADLRTIGVADPDGLAQDADTWADVRALDERMTRQAPGGDR